MASGRFPQPGLSHVFVVVGGVLLAVDVVPSLYNNIATGDAGLTTTAARAQADLQSDQKKDGAEPAAMCGATAGTCWNDHEYALLEDMRGQAREQQKKSRQLAAAREDLAAMREALQGRIERVKKLREDVVDRLEARETTAREDIERLANIYAGMRPEKAANMMNKLSLTTAADIIERIPTEAAAAIMAQMDAEPGSRLTRELNRRRRMVQGEKAVRNDAQGQDGV